MSPSADLMTALAWSLLHFFWQGAAIAALAAVTMALLREPTTRYLVGVAALVLMCASFGVTFVSLAGAPAVETEAVAAASATSSDVAPLATPGTVTLLLDRPAPAFDFTWVARVWLAVVCLLALRVACGLLLLEHLRRRSLSALPAEIVERCLALQRRLGISRVVRYCECRLVTVPSVIGFLRPIVLLPVRALTGLSAEQLEAVIAHELGHIKRFDVVVNFLQVVVETLFFFHPAVWWLNKRIRADREDCCDDVAMAICGRKAAYARALAIMDDWRATPALSMSVTGGDVANRVARLLGMNRQQTGVRSAGVLTAAVVLAAALTAGAASLGIVRPALSQIVAPVDAPLVAQAGPEAPREVTRAPVEVPREVTPAPAEAPREVTRAPVEVTRAPTEVLLAQAAPDDQSPREVRRAQSRREATRAPADAPRNGSYIDEMKAAGFDVTDVEELIAMKIHGVTGDYVRRMRDTGLELNAEEMMGMKIHGVTPEYIAQIRAGGFEPNAEEVMGLKIQGVTPEYIAQMRATGFELDAEEMMAMKIHGVTPEFIAQVRASGLEPDAEDVMAMKIHGVTPELVEQVRASGVEVGLDDVMAMQIHGVTPDFIEQVRDLGLDADFDDVIAMKIHGITPEFIEEARSHGFEDLTVEELIGLKNADVL